MYSAGAYNTLRAARLGIEKDINHAQNKAKAVYGGQSSSLKWIASFFSELALSVASTHSLLRTTMAPSYTIATLQVYVLRTL